MWWEPVCFLIVLAIYVSHVGYCWHWQPARWIQIHYRDTTRLLFPIIPRCWIEISWLPVGEPWHPTPLYTSHWLGNDWLSVTPDGLRMRLRFWNPILVPWNEVEIVAKRGLYEFKDAILIRFQKTREIAIHITAPTLEQLITLGAPFHFLEDGTLVRTESLPETASLSGPEN